MMGIKMDKKKGIWVLAVAVLGVAFLALAKNLSTARLDSAVAPMASEPKAADPTALREVLVEEKVEDPWLNGFTYRRPVTISNGSGSALTDYQIPVTVYPSSIYYAEISIASTGTALTAYQVKVSISDTTLLGRCASDGRDIRIFSAATTDPYTETSNKVDFYIESISSSSAVIWVETDVPASGGKILHMYYGDKDNVTASNGDNTFIFFDDFNDGSLDTNKWVAPDVDSYMGYAETGGKLNMYIGTQGKAQVFSGNNHLTALNSKSIPNTAWELYMTSSRDNSSDYREYYSIGPAWIDASNYSVVGGRHMQVTHKYCYYTTGTTCTANYESGSWDGSLTSYELNSIMTSTSNTYFYRNNSLIYTDSRRLADTATPWAKLQIGNGGSQTSWGEITIDYARLRKWVSTEPTATVTLKDIYELPVSLSSTGTALTNFQVRIDVTDTAILGHMDAAGDDIRVFNQQTAAPYTSSTGKLDYWVESISGSSLVLWVEVDSIPSSGGKTLYVYYGDSSASAESNGENAFIFFDDFNDGSLDTSKWDVNTKGTCSVSESGGSLTMYINATGYVGCGVTADNTITATDYKIETLGKRQSYYGGGELGAIYGFTDKTSQDTSYYGSWNNWAGFNIFRYNSNSWLFRAFYQGSTATGSTSWTSWSNQWVRASITYLHTAKTVASSFTYATESRSLTTGTGTTQLTSLRPQIHYGDYSMRYYSAWCDFFAVRQYASTEPTVTLGSESSLIPGPMQLDYDDVRFTRSDGYTLLDHWLESSSASSATFWVEVNSIPTGESMIYLYFGNPTASSASSIKNTFLLGDDFNDNSIDTTDRWNSAVTGYGVSVAETGQELKFSGTTTYNYWYDNYLPSKNTWTESVAVHIKLRHVTPSQSNGGYVAVHDGTDFGRWGVENDNGAQNLGLWLDNAGWAELDTTDIDGVYHNYDLFFNYSTGGVTVKRDSNSYTETTSSIGSFRIRICGEGRANGNVVDQRMDDIRVRKYSTAGEPVASVGPAYRLLTRAGTGAASWTWKMPEAGDLVMTGSATSWAWTTWQNDGTGLTLPHALATAWAWYPASSAYLYLAADAGAKCYVNGQLAYDGIAENATLAWWNQPVDITKFVTVGTNTLACWVAEGGENAGSGTGGLDLKLTVNGTTMIAQSDDDGSASTKDGTCSSNVSYKYYACSHYCEPGGWYISGFDDSGWSSGYAPFGPTGTFGCTSALASASTDLFVRKTFTVSNY